MNKLLPLAVTLLLAEPAFSQETVDQVESRFDVSRAPLSRSGRIIPAFDPLNAPPAASGYTFVLGGVEIVGATSFSESDFAALYTGLVGAEVSVSQIFALANDVTTFYGQAGYPLTRAVVPAQEIGASGVIRIQVVEGFIDKVEVEGRPEADRNFYAHYSNKIIGERPISNGTLERNLLLADDLPGYSAESVLRRSEDTTGATTVVLQVEEEKPASYSVTLDNRGSEAVGPYQVDLSASFANLLMPYSLTNVRLVNASLSEELLFGTLEEVITLTPEGTTLSFGAKYSKSVPGAEAFLDIELETEGRTGFVELRHPYIRSRNMNLEAFALLEARDSHTTSLGSTLSHDRIRSLRIGADFDNSDESGGLNTASFVVSKGLSGLGANANDDPENSREFGIVDYTKVTLDLSRTQQLAQFSDTLTAWSVLAKITGQSTSDPLLSSEECGFGGAGYGRGFNSSTLSGDKCFGGSLEVRYQVAEPGFVEALQLYSFYDAGSVWNLDEGADPEAVSLTSAGVGARFSINETYSGSVEYAQQLSNTGAPLNEEPGSIYFSLRGEF